MATTLKRLFWLAVLAGAGFAGWSLLRSARVKHVPPPAPRGDEPSSPSEPAGVTEPATPQPRPLATAPVAPAITVSTWVEPSEGACPASHPIKANDNSGIFHVPGGRFYERTRAERCYATPDAAVADGYRAAKS